MSQKQEPFRYALTFDDILLVPQYSEIIPSEVSTKSFFARDISLNTPIVSAAMDTVTESKIAQTMAQHGGLGMIHKNMSVENQAFHVEKVKKYESGMIMDPITLSPEHSVRDALTQMKKYSISGLPVTENGEKLVGILTNRDLRFETNLDKPISRVMTKENLVTTPEGTTLEEAKKLLHEHRIEKLLVVDKQGNLSGLITIKDIEKAKAYPLASKDSHGRLLVGAAVGVGSDSTDRVCALLAAGVDVLTIDTAHGHSRNVLKMIDYVREKSADVSLVAGNVVTADGSSTLFDRGVDVVKVGVGPGSICTTRVVAGVGMPQITAIMDCAEVAKKKGKTIIADGGIKFSGDLVKAIALGANTVMIGNLLAGTTESPGEMILYQGRSYKSYRGMGSLGAMDQGSKDRYGQADVFDADKLVPEGIEGKVAFKGAASGVMHQLLGGLKSGMGYLGATSVQELQDKADFVRISPQGLKESHVHDVSITKEAPNYRLS